MAIPEIKILQVATFVVAHYPGGPFMKLPDDSIAAATWGWTDDQDKAAIFESFDEFAALMYNSAQHGPHSPPVKDQNATCKGCRWVMIPVLTFVEDIFLLDRAIG